MNIAIIGSGHVGTALGTTFARAGHRVIYGARNPEHAREAAQAVNGHAFGIEEAAQRGDVIVLAVPYASAGHDVAAEIEPVAAGKIVIDVSNPLNADYSGLVTSGGPSAAENYAAWLPEARIVKAFNTLFAQVQADPKLHGQELDALFATDDQEVRGQAEELLRSMGLRPVYAGPLVRSRELEALGFLLISLQMSAGGDWRTTMKMIDPPKGAVGQGARTATSSRRKSAAKS